MVKTRFLIVDDDADDASFFCEALSHVAGGTKCLKAENGREALEFLSEAKDGKPDVIFLDINMPVMNGWECLKRLKSSPDLVDIPAVMYSTSSAAVDISSAYRLGAFLFVEKPEDFNELRRILQIMASTPQELLMAQLNGISSVRFQGGKPGDRGRFFSFRE